VFPKYHDLCHSREEGGYIVTRDYVTRDNIASLFTRMT